MTPCSTGPARSGAVARITHRDATARLASSAAQGEILISEDVDNAIDAPTLPTSNSPDDTEQNSGSFLKAKNPSYGYNSLHPMSSPDSASAPANLAAPRADHHQHLFSPAVVAMLARESTAIQAITASDVLALLDAAHIQRALLLSVAYMFGSPKRAIPDELAQVQAENDWTAAQAAAYPHRLRAFGSVNPLKEYALDEIARCAAQPHLRHGLKLHFGNSDVQLDNPAHLRQLKRVFRAANDQRMAIVVHLRPSISRGRPYGAAHARTFLEELLPLMTHVPVQIAHLAGTGPGYDDPPADSAMAVFAEAVRRGEPHSARLWFDVATVVDVHITPSHAALVAQRIRAAGVERVLFGSDAALGANLRPAEAWAAFRRLPLTAAEFAAIAANLAPYLR